MAAKRSRYPREVLPDCRHISFDFDAWGYFSGRSDYWFAPGVGIVKFGASVRGRSLCCVATDRLQRYRRRVFPDGRRRFRRYVPESLGDGWHGSVEFTFDEDEVGTVMF